VRVLFAIAALAACNHASGPPDAPASPWSRGPDLPLPRLEAGVAAVGQRLVVAGGFYTNAFDVTARVDVFDPSMGNGKWLVDGSGNSPFQDLPVLRHHIQLAAIGTTVYALGGLDGMISGTSYPARGDCWALDTTASPLAWRQIATIPAGLERGSAGVIVAPPRIYLVGGAGTTTALASVIYYDTIQDAWTQQAPDLPQPRSHPAVMRRLDGAFVLVGGMSGLYADSAVDDAWLLAPDQMTAAGHWVSMPPTSIPLHDNGLSSARGGCAYGVIQGRLVCAGGEGGQAAFHLVQSYDPVIDTWYLDADLPADRAGTQGAAIGQRLFVPGGSATIWSLVQAPTPTSTLYIYAPL
jgi:hypothetical protein